MVWLLVIFVFVCFCVQFETSKCFGGKNHYNVLFINYCFHLDILLFEITWMVEYCITRVVWPNLLRNFCNWWCLTENVLSIRFILLLVQSITFTVFTTIWRKFILVLCQILENRNNTFQTVFVIQCFGLSYLHCT